MRKFGLLFLTFLLVTESSAQDPQYSQFYASPLYLNPAFAGTGSNTRVAVNHRILWPNLPKAFSTSSISVDYNAENLNSGFGALVTQDVAGTAGLQNIAAAFIYSYRVRFNNKFVMQSALKFGYAGRQFDPSRLVLGDQIDFGGGAASQDPNVNAIRLKGHWDIGTGILMYSRKYWFGVGVEHLTQPNRSLLEGTDELPIRYSIHFGGRYPLQKLLATGSVGPSIAPSVLYKRQGTFQQLDIGASVHLQPVIIGLYYRGLPFTKEEFGRINQDAIIVQAGVEYFNLELGYSFDMNLSRINPVVGGGAHEFSLVYNFRIPTNPYKIKRSQKILKCPVFIMQNMYREN